MALQANTVDDERARAEIRQAAVRINAVLNIHAKMYQSESPETVDLLSTVRLLCRDLNDSVAGNGSLDRVRVSGEPVVVPGDSMVSLSLIVTELVTNALKHAYAPGEEGAVTVEIGRGPDGRLCLSVADEGRGLPADFDPATAGRGLGMKVIRGSLRNLDGELAIERRPRGVAFRVRVPLG